MLNDSNYHELSRHYDLDVLHAIFEEGGYINDYVDGLGKPNNLQNLAVPVTLARYIIDREFENPNSTYTSSRGILRLALDLCIRCEVLEGQRRGP